MKPKGLLISVVLLAVLAGAIWWSNRAEAKKAAKGTDASTQVLTIPDDQYQEFQIKKDTGEVERLTREGGKWRITEPQPLPADQDAVASMVTSLSSLNADKVIDEKPDDLKA